ncbi:4-(cytidine 5'-diphospho)-2-C-methyl-D-erythritol kinase, partial [bacterium]|nr:4-(cytidine 5'-diphospho)-2-C-methyl-D-erythritol kinase [bacterium]
HDEIQINTLREDKIEVQTDSPNVPDGEKNIVYKAIGLLKKFFDIKEGVSVFIKKKIPSGGGLGGGSSNAGVVINYLTEHWHLDINNKEVKSLISFLGADVPFFVQNKPLSLCRGIGDITEPVEISLNLWFVVVNPLICINTKQMYGKIKLTYEPKQATIVVDKIIKNSFENITKNLFNRFEEFVVPIYPVIKEIKSQLIKLGCESSLMSGSGSTVFGLVRNKEAGENIVHAFKNIHPDWFCCLSRSMILTN